MSDPTRGGALDAAWDTPGSALDGAWGDEAPKKAKPTGGVAKRIAGILASGGQGALANFGDEVAGVFGGAAETVQNAGHNLVTGDHRPVDFNASRKRIQQTTRDQLKEYSTEHPVESTVAQIAGGIAPALASGGASVAGRLGLTGLKAAATEGAAYGAAAGAGGSDGDLLDRAKSGLTGGLLGGALGTAGGVAVKGAGKLAEGLRSLMTPVSEKAGAAADDILAQAAQREGGLRTLARNAVQDKAVGFSVPVVGTSGGKGIEDLSWLAANTPSPAQNAFVGALSHTQGELRPVLERGLEKAAGVSGNAYRKVQQIEGQQALSANRLYGAANAAPPVDAPHILDQIKSEPAMLDAVERTVQGLGDKATQAEHDVLAYLRGSDEVAPGIDIGHLKAQGYNDGMIAKLAEQAGQQAPPPPPIPVRLLNEMKKGLDDLTGSLLAKDQNFTRMDAGRIRDKMGSVLDEVDTEVPEYAKARSVFQNDASRLDAVKAGQGALTQRPERIADEVGGKVDLTDEPFSRPLPTQNKGDYKLGLVDAAKLQLAEKAKTRLPNYTGSVLGDGAPIDRINAGLEGGAASFAPVRASAKRVESTIQRALGGSSTGRNLATAKVGEEFTPADALKLIESPRRAVFNFLGRLSTKQRASFHTALANELAERLTVDPTGAAGVALFKRLQSVLDSKSAAAVKVLADKAAKTMRITGRLSGQAAGAVAR